MNKKFLSTFWLDNRFILLIFILITIALVAISSAIFQLIFILSPELSSFLLPSFVIVSLTFITLSSFFALPGVAIFVILRTSSPKKRLLYHQLTVPATTVIHGQLLVYLLILLSLLLTTLFTLGISIFPHLFAARHEWPTLFNALTDLQELWQQRSFKLVIYGTAGILTTLITPIYYWGSCISLFFTTSLKKRVVEVRILLIFLIMLSHTIIQTFLVYSAFQLTFFSENIIYNPTRQIQLPLFISQGISVFFFIAIVSFYYYIMQKKVEL